MDRHEALRLAGEAVTARQTKYGSPEDNFNRIARRWNAHLVNLNITDDVCVLTAADVAIMMADVKLARLANDPTHADSWVDIAGYGACGAEVSAAEAEAVAAAWRKFYEDEGIPTPLVDDVAPAHRVNESNP